MVKICTTVYYMVYHVILFKKICDSFLPEGVYITLKLSLCVCVRPCV